MAAGELNPALRGGPRRSYDAEVNGGAGKGVVHLPSGGVHAAVPGGAGKIHADGRLRRSGSPYYSHGWDEAKTRVNLRVRGGIGKIKLIASE